MLVVSFAVLVLGVLEVSIWSIPLGALLIVIGAIGLIYGFDQLPRHGSTGGPGRKREATGGHPRTPVANHDRPAGDSTEQDRA